MKLFLFNNDEKLIGTVSPLECIQNEEINKIQTIECTTVYSELIEKASYIGHKDYNDNRIFHLYKIDHVTKTSTTDVKIVGVHTFFDDMESDGYIKDFRPTNRELVGVLTTILDGSRWQLGTVNIQRRYTGNFYYVTRKEAISKLIEATQIEIKPRLEFSRGKIIGRYLDVFTRLGARNGKVFVHGRDLLTVSEKKSQGAIYTAVVGRGKGEETDTGGYGRRITFKDVEWRRTSGQPVDKPVGQEYVEIPAMTRLYGFEKGTKPRIKIVEFQDETDKEKLLRLSYEWLEKNSRMQVEYSAKVLNVGNLELGDTVGIFNPNLGIKYETRVFKVKRNLVNNKLTEFGIGDKVTTSPFSRTIELAKEMKNFQDDTVYWLDKIRERLSDKLINEDGYNYDLKADNEYKVPAGYYSFDKPIDQNPTKVVYMGAGKIAIADSKKPTGEWNWKTFLDGRGATLDLINTGVLKAGRIQSADGRSYWDLDTGEFHMEQNAINEAVKTVVDGKVQEIVGDIKKNLPTKEELKGKSSYIHKKYSDNADGRDMSDNSNLKYIGIYTGDKEQAPTNASEYSWTKIKGEDGERGRDGVDGKSINRNYISDSDKLNSKGFYGWNKWDKSVEGDTLVLTKVGGSDTYGFYFNLTELVKTQFQNETITWSMDVRSSKNCTFNRIGFETNGQRSFNLTTQWQRISHTFVNKFVNYYAFTFYNPTSNFNNGDKIYIRFPKLETGNVATEWSPAYEDLQGHTLTANVRFEGTYINNVTNNVKIFAEVYYDGKKVINGYNLKIKHKGGNNTQWGAFYTRNYTENGEILQYDWGNKEQNGTPLEVIVLIDYKGMSAVATSRMENIPDVVEIKEITKKYKTFDSTLDQFNSTIGEVKQQVLAIEEKRNLVLGSRMLSESDFKKLGNSVDLTLNQAYEGFPYLSVYSYDQTSKVWQGVGFKLSISKISKGETYSIRIPVFFGRTTNTDEGSYLEIKNHNTQQVLWRTRLDLDKYKKGEWNVLEYKFTATRDLDLGDSSFWIYHVKNGYLAFAKPYMCEGNALPKNYSPAPEDVYLQNSRIESSIKQTKDEIGLKVSKDNVINSINISGEGTRITGNAIADYLYGKTIEGATIQGNSKIKIGQYGFLQPIDKGLQINAPENFGSKRGVGLQISGTGVNPKQTGIPPGLFIYENSDFTKSSTIPNSVNRVLLTVAGMACFSSRVLGSVVKGQPVLTNLDYTSPFTNVAPVKFIGYREGGFMHFYGTDDSDSDAWLIKVDQWGSDRKLKTDIKNSEFNAIEFVDKLKFKEHGWNKDEVGYDRPHTKCGLIAQELQELDASLVVDYGKYLGLDGLRLINISLKAIQELSAENQQLKLQLKEMDERLNKLEDKINGNI
ncbi:phage tail spike protein [Gemella haemolysans]|uniref:phage tail spike protein n=1 Tax=Gemella haemolysans TaxID=1379 RepID=UPI00195A94EB|nr:phage tail spike protein [Gemella haemolysans]VTX71957.1 Chaperone of endosialidase [Gemella haemolysans]